MIKLLLFAFLVETTPVPHCASLQGGDASLGQHDAICQQSQLETGSMQQTCHWSFPAGQGGGADRFGEITRLIEHCLPDAAILPPEPGVNHPDSYDQRIYLGQGWRVSLSLKKKSALNASFVFLSLSPLP